MSQFIKDVASCAYGVAAPWVNTGARCENLHTLDDLATRVEAMRRGRQLGNWGEGRFVWGDAPGDQRRKVEVSFLQGDGKVAVSLSLLVRHESLAQVRSAVEASAARSQAAA